MEGETIHFLGINRPTADDPQTVYEKNHQALFLKTIPFYFNLGDNYPDSGGKSQNKQDLEEKAYTKHCHLKEIRNLLLF